MGDIDREGPIHASRPSAPETLTLAQLETTLAEALASATRMNQLEQIWSRRKPRLSGVLLTTRADALFDLCHENDVGFYYTIRDMPGLYEAAKAAPHLRPRAQAIVTALHRSQHEVSRAADEIGLTGAYQESAEQQQAAAQAADAILRQAATSMAVLVAKARVLAASRGLDLTQDPWSLSIDERALLVLLQDLLAASPAPTTDA